MANTPWDDVDIYNGPLFHVRESAGTTDDDLWAFRRLTGQDRPDQLDEGAYDKYQRLSSWLYYQNPLARRLCDVVTDMCLGGGIKVEVDQSKTKDVGVRKVKEFIDRFRTSPVNEFDIRLPGLFTQLSTVNGELFLPVFVNPTNGDLALGYLENHLVSKVEFDPVNRMKAIGVVQPPAIIGEKPIWWNVVQAEDNGEEVIYPPHPSFERDIEIRRAPVDYVYGGELLYFKTNVLGSGRGRSALEPALDWLHAYDNFLFGDLRNANLQAAFVWDVSITGATGPELKAKRDEIMKNPPRPGEVNIHNEKEIWQALSPNLNAADHTELGIQVKKVIGLSVGLPPHLIGAENDTNRTSSVSSDVPFIRRMEQRQQLLMYLVGVIYDYQLDQKKHSQLLSGVERPYPYRLVPPKLNANELVGQAEALYNITQSILDSTRNRITSLNDGRRIWYNYGLSEVDIPDDIEEQIESEIKSGKLPDIVKNEQEEVKAKAKQAKDGSVAGRGLRAKSISGR